jgi:hypothetical protein
MACIHRAQWHAKEKVLMDLENAIELLQDGNFTCVLCCEDRIYTTNKRGVSPLVQWLQQGSVPKGFSAADKVAGKATAFLYCLLGARAVYADVMSQGAKSVLEDNGIHASYGVLTDYIQNRTKDGVCPFENAVSGCKNPDDALAAIYKMMEMLDISI